MDRSDALRLAESARVARLATVSTDLTPHIVPIVFAFDGDELVTAVDHKPKRSRRLQRLVNLRANPRASVLIDHYDDEWENLWWVRIDGLARVVESGDGLVDAIEALVTRYDQYTESRPEGPVIRIRLDRVVGWRAV